MTGSLLLPQFPSISFSSPKPGLAERFGGKLKMMEWRNWAHKWKFTRSLPDLWWEGARDCSEGAVS